MGTWPGPVSPGPSEGPQTVLRRPCHSSPLPRSPRASCPPSLAPTPSAAPLRPPGTSSPSGTRAMDSVLATQHLQGTRQTQEPRLAADPGTGAQRAAGTMRRQAALPSPRTAPSFPLGCASWTARPRTANSLNFSTGRQVEMQSSGESSRGLDTGLRSCENT